jgi:hypothetical protein
MLYYLFVCDEYWALGGDAPPRKNKEKRSGLYGVQYDCRRHVTVRIRI